MSPRTHRVRVRFAIPASVLRALLVVVGAAGVLALNPYGIWRGAAVLALVVGAAMPRTLASWAAMAAIVLGVALAEPAPGRTALAVLAVHLIHVLGSLTLVIPLRSRIAPRALLPSLVRLIVVQAIAQPLALLVTVLPTVRVGVPWLAPAGGVVVLVLALLVLALRRRGDRAVR